MPVVSLVGYTNAGKSTLLNRLSKAGVRAENRMFSTLDPVTRRLRLPSGAPALITDTVGFIHKLPTTLVASFRATLEEIAESTLILHIVDATHKNAQEQIGVVESILEDLGMGDVPIVTVLNKSDMLTDTAALQWQGRDLSMAAKSGVDGDVWISALTGDGIEELLELVESILDTDDENTDSADLPNHPKTVAERLS